MAVALAYTSLAMHFVFEALSTCDDVETKKTASKGESRQTVAQNIKRGANISTAESG